MTYLKWQYLYSPWTKSHDQRCIRKPNMSTLFHLTNAKCSFHILTLYIAYNTKLPNIATVLLLSVDDVLFCGPNKAIVDEVKAHFMQKWDCRDLGEVCKFLHMCICWNGCNISIN